MNLHETLNAEVSFNCFVLERNINTKHHCDDTLKPVFSDLPIYFLSAYDITVVQSLVIFSSLTTMM